MRRREAAGGGGARSQVWLQLTADVCDLPITVPRYADACGVKGSAICAACFCPSLAEAAGSMVSEERRIEPRGISAQFEHGYQSYLRLYEATRPLL